MFSRGYLDLGKLLREQLGHVLPRHVSGREHEGSYAGRFDRSHLDLAAPDAFVLRQHNPTAVSNFRQPILIKRVGGEMVPMNFDRDPAIPQGGYDGAAFQAAVHEER